MAIILGVVLTIVVSGVVMWVIAKLFADESPNIFICFIGAAIAELVSLIGIPFISFLVLLIILMKVGGFRGFPAFFATILYGIIKFALSVLIFSSL